MKRSTLLTLATFWLFTQIGCGQIVRTNEVEDGPKPIEPSAAKVLGLYPILDVISIEFWHAGGYPPPHPVPEYKLIVKFSPTLSSGVSITKVGQDEFGDWSCDFAMNMEDRDRLVLNLTNAYIRRDLRSHIGVDAGTDNLRVYGAEGKVLGEFPFKGPEVPNNAPFIEGEQLLSQLVRLNNELGCTRTF